jgi:hypothetical protein
MASLLPIAIAGAVVPTWTAHVVLLLGTARPVLNASLYVLGITIARLAIGLIVILFTGTAAFESMTQAAQSGRGAVPSAWVAGFGALLLATGVLLILRKPKPAEGSELPKWMRTLEGFPPWAAFTWGFVNFLLPGVQYIYFLGGMAIIVAPGMSQTAEIAWTLFFVGFLDLMLITPIVLFASMHERIRPGLDRTKSWLGRNGARLAGGILAFFGVYLLLRGLGVLGI